MEKINRDEDQEDKARLWLESDRVNTLILGTGYGKSRVAMLILQELFNSGELTKNSKILLLSNSERLRDTSWKDDFNKWGFNWIWDIVRTECYQTVYKWEESDWDFVIADEIDFSITEEYVKFFGNNQYSMLLGLTGYVAESKRSLLDSIAPILVEYSTQDAQEDGLLNQTQITFISFDLSQNKTDIEVKYKKNGKEMSFTQSENDAYDYAENQCNILWGKLDALNKDPDVSLGLDSEKIAERNKISYKLKRAQAQRKDILYNSKASVQTAKDLIELLLKHPDNKIITFSALTDQADRINEITYHGKNKKVNFDVLEKLSEGKIRSVGVCKAINRGENIMGLNSLIQESYDGSTTQFTQKHGRGTRLNPNEVMNMYIFLPFYYKKVKSPENHGGNTHVRRPTQAVKWAEDMLSDFKVNNPIFVRKGVGKNDWRRDFSKT
ncbi:helicase-related protein [Tenacibaculum sp.]|uniref:helicase-related protein n=1 Tax=Tenacibaculum sp. TaxID=1906242 RepID=UPI003D129357